ncbi:MAG: hypothetical protein PHU44_05055 [Syntrophales bacterium]|nr:hypothetical protein [Syntrophales bacterium]MDD5642182.1 hypothetical protein [Syntrophales bacterium]
MKKFACLGMLLVLLVLTGCASDPGVTPYQDRSANYNWGSDAVCSPGCPTGMSGSW